MSPVQKLPTWPRIFLGTIEISGNYSSLAAGLRELGQNVTVMFSSQNPFNYSDESIIPVKLTSVRGKARLQASGLPAFVKKTLLFPLRAWGAGVLFFSQVLWALTVIKEHDVFIFGYGSSLLPRNLDLVLLRFFPGKVVISNIEHGSEALPPVADGAWLTADDSVVPVKTLRRLTAATRRTVMRHEKYADVLIGNPMSSSYFGTKKMVNSYVLGRPLDLSKRTPDPAGEGLERGDFLDLIHVPSHAPGKGTRKIEAAIEGLRAENIEFRYRRIEGMSNSEVLREIAQACDLVVDQTYSDRYWSKVAAEAALFGKPTLLAGYAFPVLEEIIPPELRPPVFWCHPDDFESKLREILSDPPGLIAMGLRARDFAERNYRADRVASNYLRLFDPNSVPEDWMFDPMEVFYFGGCGQNLEKTAMNYRSIISKYGKSALGLSHKRRFQNEVAKAFSP